MMATGNRSIFVTGIGTGVGKTVVSAIVAQALNAAYWKPVQCGVESGTDSHWVKQNTTDTIVFPESYCFQLPASPHIAARAEGTSISIKKIVSDLPAINRNLIIEGAGGLLVPVNETEFVRDLILALDVEVILVSRNYLGSINHSLLTADACKHAGLKVMGWVFNDQYLDYEEEIVKWSGIPKIASIPFCSDPRRDFILEQATAIRQRIATLLC
jgi:dethiobiotin synthetase